MDIFILIPKYFWLIAILVTSINCMMFRIRAKKHIAAKPELKDGYATLLRGYLFWMNLPWVVMGIGCTVGRVPSVWYYFRPRDGNPYVLAWFASIVLLWVLGTFWLFFRGGAETLVRYPGVLQAGGGLKSRNIASPVLFKVIWLLALTGGVIAMVTMWILDIPIQHFAQ